MDTDGKRMNSLKGIKKRWVRNYILVIFIMIVLIEGLFLFLIKNYYYKNIEENLTNRVEVVSGFYNKYLSLTSYNLESNTKQFIKKFNFNDYAEVQVLDRNGNIVLNSTGFKRDERIKTEDFIKALEDNASSWVGKSITSNEKIMAVSAPIKDFSGEIIGVLRFVTSLEGADKIVTRWFLISLGVIMVVMILVSVLSTIFTRTIIIPVKEITEASKKIAKGQLDVKIDKLYNDEIGELADTINYMASELDKLQKMKNDFISSISHELRTPLTSIKGWGETIITGDLKNKEETKTGLKIIINETQRLTKMVEELLDFARLENGHISLDIKKIDVKKELDEIVHIFEGKAKKKNIEISYNSEEDFFFTIGDKNRLRQVFINILDNAIKFTDEERNIYVKIYEKKGYILVSFQDEGIGIPQNEIKKIKEKFYKGKSKKEGSGLGLAISTEIINLHEGKLNIESQEEVGTTITIILPKKN